MNNRDYNQQCAKCGAPPDQLCLRDCESASGKQVAMGSVCAGCEVLERERRILWDKAFGAYQRIRDLEAENNRLRIALIHAECAGGGERK